MSGISIRVWGPHSGERPQTVAECAKVIKNPENLVWIDLESPDHTHLSELAAELGLSPTGVEDALAPHERTKIMTYTNDHISFVTYALRVCEECDDGGRLQSSRISGFLLDHALVTIRLDDAFDIEAVMDRVDGEIRGRKEMRPEVVLHGLLDWVVDGHFDAIQIYDDLLEDLEEELFSTDGPVPRDFSGKAYAVRKELGIMRRHILPMRDVVVGLIRHFYGNRPDPWFQDLEDHVLRAAEWSDSLRDMVNSLVVTQLQLQDSRLNVVTKKLAAWAAIIAVPTFITGWFGQNIPYLGFAQPWGVWFSIGLIVASAGTLYVVMKRADWL